MDRITGSQKFDLWHLVSLSTRMSDMANDQTRFMESIALRAEFDALFAKLESQGLDVYDLAAEYASAA